MTTRTAIAAGIGAVVLAAGGFVAADSIGITPLSATVVTGVTPGQTDATVTVATTP